MNALELQQKIFEREEEILIFVQKHYDELRDNWEQWLNENSIPQQVIEMVDASDKIRLSDVRRYRVECDDSNGLRFLEINQEDPEWNISTAGIHIETDGSLSTGAERRAYKKRI